VALVYSSQRLKFQVQEYFLRKNNTEKKMQARKRTVWIHRHGIKKIIVIHIKLARNFFFLE